MGRSRAGGGREQLGQRSEVIQVPCLPAERWPGPRGAQTKQRAKVTDIWHAKHPRDALTQDQLLPVSLMSSLHRVGKPFTFYHECPLKSPEVSSHVSHHQSPPLGFFMEYKVYFTAAAVEGFSLKCICLKKTNNATIQRTAGNLGPQGPCT